jgi:hypothetical protein
MMPQGAIMTASPEVCMRVAQESSHAFHEAFADPAALAGMILQGEVALSASTPFRGSACLELHRGKTVMESQPTSAVLPVFTVREGLWDLAVALRAQLYSPDSSYNGTVRLLVMDGAGRELERHEVAIITGDNGWTVRRKRLELPPEAAQARFTVTMEKTWGSFAVGELTCAYAGPSLHIIKAIACGSDAVGNLFLPDQPLRFGITARCSKEIAASQRIVTCTVRDYWGAEHGRAQVALDAPGRDGEGRPTYAGVLDFAGHAFETGRYYELHLEMPEPHQAEPARDTSSFAILPQAVTKQHKPFDVPFTASGWNPGVPGFFPLCDRLGLRVANVYSRWSADPPYRWTAPGIDEVKALGMGALLGTPVHHVEIRGKGWEAYDETAMREGARNLIAAFKDQLPIALRVGNEPHPIDDDDVRRMIRTYRAVYEGAKAADPSITVTATSCGPEEAFFRLGYQDTHDVYIFHQYADAQVITGDFQRYEALVAKHGKRRPVWSTELGLNSQGMARSAVAVQLIKILTNFFACGGVNASWFGIMWPDPDGSNVGTNGDSFDVFNSKYCLYSPKLTAITEYHFVNAICVKRFVEQRTYPDGTQLTLFRDDAGRSLVVAWRDGGRNDVLLPLPAGQVRATRLDGGSSGFTTADGLTLGLFDEPYLLEFSSATWRLPAKLGKPRVAIDGAVAPVVKGGGTRITLRGPDIAVAELVAPPGWTVRRDAAGVFTITAPATTTAREGRLLVRLGTTLGEIQVPVAVVDALDVRFVPAPRTADGGGAGMELHLSNRGPTAQRMRWSVSMPETWAMAGGTFRLNEPAPFVPAFSTPASGEVELPPGGGTAITVRTSNLDPLALYRARLELADGERSSVRERLFGGCVGVPRVRGGVVFDGRFGDPAWSRAEALHLDQPGQFAALTKRTAHWDGPEDLSGIMRLLWDDDFLYLGMQVRDDVFCQPEVDGNIWRGDGLQFLIDPCRDSTEKPGRYDYIVALSSKGQQAWCHASADAARAPAEEVTDFRMRLTRTGERGDMNYEIAIPWHRLSPFKARPGGNLGLAMIINNDDGHIRDSFMAWFGCAHSKQMGMNGDLILLG